MPMVKTLHQAFSDENYQALQEVKGDRNWRDAILEEFGVNDNE